MCRPPEVTNDPFETAWNMLVIQPVFCWPALLRYGSAATPVSKIAAGLLARPR